MSVQPSSGVVIRVHAPGIIDAPRIFDLPGQYVVGSEADCAVRLPPNVGVAPRHALLILEGSTLRISKLTSTDELIRNGQTIDSSELHSGDRVRCGSVGLEFTIFSSDPRTLTITSETAVLAAESAARMEFPAIKGFSDIELIGQGALGRVFKARQLGSNSVVAIKCIRPELQADEVTREVFMREASIISQLRHPRIVRCLGFGLSQGTPYLVLEYLQSENLERIVWQHEPPRRIRVAVKVALQVLEALNYAHDSGIVHRDIKPSNLLATITQGRMYLKVSDFGLAKVFQIAGHSGITPSQEIRGTLAYMSPEQLLDSRGAKPDSDVYSVVVCLYRLLTGEFPHPDGTPSEMIYRILNSDPRPIQSVNPAIPDDVARIVDKGLARSPGSRFGSARSLSEALSILPCVTSRRTIEDA